MENTTPTHARFDRYEIFEKEDHVTVLDSIQEVMGKSGELTNKLYGLYDGYLYFNLLELTQEHLSQEQNQKVEALVNKIKKHYTYTG